MQLWDLRIGKRCRIIPVETQAAQKEPRGGIHAVGGGRAAEARCSCGTCKANNVVRMLSES
jgi:hypothetical protein